MRLLLFAVLAACVAMPTTAAFISCADELPGAIVVLRNNSLFSNLSRVANPLYNEHPPAFVVLPRDAGDVQRALACAGRNGVPVALKAGGHSFAGYSSVPSPGFTIDFANMTAVAWVGNSTVRVQAGARWRDVYAAFKEHGGLWVVTGGLCPSVGVAGFTMGGGVGPCAREYGLAIDNVVRFTMVTADGSRVVTADADHNTDLFWALRGGGGSNFGAVVEIDFRVHEGPEEYTWGTVCYPPGADNTRAALAQLDGVAAALPGVTNVDAVLEPGGGLCLWIVHLGPKAETEAVLVPLTTDGAIAAATVSLSAHTCYWEMIQAFAEAHGYAEFDDDPFYSRTALVESVALVADVMASADAPPTCDQHLIHFGGAVSAVAPHETAFFWRSTEYMVYASCGFSNDDERATAVAFLDAWWAKMLPFVRGSYVNFIDRSLPNWKEMYYGGNLPRILDIKRRWNPAGKGPLHFAQEIDAPHAPPQ